MESTTLSNWWIQLLYCCYCYYYHCCCCCCQSQISLLHFFFVFISKSFPFNLPIIRSAAVKCDVGGPASPVAPRAAPPNAQATPPSKKWTVKPIALSCSIHIRFVLMLWLTERNDCDDSTQWWTSKPLAATIFSRTFWWRSTQWKQIKIQQKLDSKSIFKLLNREKTSSFHFLNCTILCIGDGYGSTIFIIFHKSAWITNFE